jgi:hypothetical protein
LVICAANATESFKHLKYNIRVQILKKGFLDFSIYLQAYISLWKLKIMHVKYLPKNDLFGRVGFGRVVFWSSCLPVELSFGRVGLSRPVVIELSFGRVVAHSVSTAASLLVCALGHHHRASVMKPLQGYAHYFGQRLWLSSGYGMV